MRADDRDRKGSGRQRREGWRAAAPPPEAGAVLARPADSSLLGRGLVAEPDPDSSLASWETGAEQGCGSSLHPTPQAEASVGEAPLALLIT